MIRDSSVRVLRVFFLLSTSGLTSLDKFGSFGLATDVFGAHIFTAQSCWFFFTFQ